MFPTWLRSSEQGWTLLTHYFWLAEQTTALLTFNCNATTCKDKLLQSCRNQIEILLKTPVTNVCSLINAVLMPPVRSSYTDLVEEVHWHCSLALTPSSQRKLPDMESDTRRVRPPMTRTRSEPPPQSILSNPPPSTGTNCPPLPVFSLLFQQCQSHSRAKNKRWARARKTDRACFDHWCAGQDHKCITS